MADIEEKIAAVFDLFDKHGNELYIGMYSVFHRFRQA